MDFNDKKLVNFDEFLAAALFDTRHFNDPNIELLFSLITDGSDIAKENLQESLFALSTQKEKFWDELFEKYDPNKTGSITKQVYKGLFSI